MLTKTKLWVTISNTDLTEGRGKPVIIAYSKTKSYALAQGKGKGVQGSSCRVDEQYFLVDEFGSVYQEVGRLDPNEPEQSPEELAVKKALSLGLTPEEIQLLKNL